VNAGADRGGVFDAVPRGVVADTAGSQSIVIGPDIPEWWRFNQIEFDGTLTRRP
jgi:hypothetical protein